MNDKCNDNLYIKPVEVCNFKALNKLHTKTNKIKYKNDSNKIFKNDLITDINELNYNFRDINDNKFNYNENDLTKKSLCYPTDITKKDYYLNCVLETENPLFTFKDGVCMVHPDLNLNNQRLIKGDDGFVYINNAKDEEGNFKYFKKKNTAYCEDKWFDWIITPNYHFGNRYYRDSGAYSKEDVKKCYKPCGMGRLPYLNDNNEYICVSKDVVYDGIYRNKLDYSPIALINLIGNNKENLKKLYENLYEYELNNIDITYYEKNSENNLTSFDVNDAIDEIKKVLNTIVTDNNLNIPSYSTEKNHLTYKHPNFNENDETLLTYIGLEKNDVITNDIILIHTAYLALGYYNFLNSIIDISNGFKEETITNDVEKFNNHNFNIMRVLEKLNIISYDTNINLTIKKQQRLANILYKAINICYNNKTDFSKNIILKTQEAINRRTNTINYNNILTETNKLINGLNIKFFSNNELKNMKLFKENIKIPDVPSFSLNNFIFFTEEISELLNDKRCIAGQFLKDNKCVKCSEKCIKPETCNNNSECQIYCKNECNQNEIINKDSRCGRRVNDEDKIKSNEIVDNVKTPIDDENYIPNFSYIFKTSIKIFFALIIVFVAYIFYKLFGETILTLLNMIYYPFIQLIRKIIYRNEIKYAENNYDIIKNKYDEISRSLIKSNALKGH